MVDITFENLTFDPNGPGVDDDYIDLPDPPVTEPPFDVQLGLNTSGNRLLFLQDELRQGALEDQKKRLVDAFYGEVSRTYELLARRYGAGGAYALRRLMGLTGYRSGASQRLGREVVETLQSAEETLPKNIESIELKDLSGVADTTSQSVEDVETALKTINDPQIDVAWVTQATREFAGVKGAMTWVRDELANNLAKLSDAKDQKSQEEKLLARDRRKLTETDDPEIQEEIRNRMKRRQGKISDLELEIQARLEATSANVAALRSQVSRIRETIRRLLHEDKTLVERIRTLFPEQGITIASILTAIGMAISTLVLALTGGGSAPVPSSAWGRFFSWPQGTGYLTD